MGRTFIQPTNRLRQINVALKFSKFFIMNHLGKSVIMSQNAAPRKFWSMDRVFKNFNELFLGAILTNVKGKRIILIDDSIVRGNTIGPIIRLLRKAGAKEVHIRVASPPLKYPCYMGINIPTKEELIANKLSDSDKFAEKVGKRKNFI